MKVSNYSQHIFASVLALPDCIRLVKISNDGTVEMNKLVRGSNPGYGYS